MFEELNERRKAVERNIAKGFGMDDADLDFEKALEDELEKGRAKKTFAVGDTFTRHGITYKCTGISANTGRPTWSKVKDGGGKQEQSIKDVLSEIIHMDASDEVDSTYQSDIVKRLQNHINKENISKEKFQNYLNAAGVNAEWCGYLKSVLNFKKEEQQPEKKEKREEENKALSKELDSVSGFKRMTLHGPGYDYFEISKLSSGVYSLRGYKSQSSSPLLRTYSKKEILDKIKELNLKSSGVKTDPSLTNGL